MSRNLVKLFRPDTIEGYRVVLAFLFGDIETQFGRDAAVRLFHDTPPTKKKLKESKDELLLWLYHRMERRSVEKLAHWIAEENKRQAPNERYGPRGSIEPKTIERHIWKLLRAQKLRPQLNLEIECPSRNEGLVKYKEPDQRPSAPKHSRKG